MSLIVLKFGGTSLRDLSKESKILDIVKENIKEGNKLVIVVSAIGRDGDPYATDTLIHKLEDIDLNIDPKKKDFIMSCGEIISAAIVSHLLDTEGFPAEPLTGFQAGISTDDTFNSSKILEIDINRIITILDQGKIAVVAGFQGITKELEITTLGRGGSDTTAVALGGFLDADRVDIYTDVNGVYMIDPKIVDKPKFIESISYEYMHSLAKNGASVIHPRAVLTGMKYKTPIRILSTFEKGLGTTISNIDIHDKVIGYAIKKGDENGIISLVYNNYYKDEILMELCYFLETKKKDILQIIYSEEMVSFAVKNENIIDFSKALYNHFME